MIAATLHLVEEELDMSEEERCEEYWRTHRFQPFDRAIPLHKTQQRARELQLKLDLIELLLLGLRPDWIPPAWFPSSLPPPQLPPRNEELRQIAGLPSLPSLGPPPRVDGAEEGESTPSQPSRSGSRRGRRQVATNHRRDTVEVQVGAQGVDLGAGSDESVPGRSLRPRASLRTPLNADGTLRIRPSYRF